ncbi:MAG: hypothetical protein KatS3mg105_3008 [Gemmatales bacterium]|nr:MAG: hypothetical protein KatS3mg105_3008 [Gemmatales bacterium]
MPAINNSRRTPLRLFLDSPTPRLYDRTVETVQLTIRSGHDMLPTARLGQIIGDQLERAIYTPLKTVADEFGLYLDFKHERPARGGRRAVAWKDKYGNVHDLDYVLEEGGSEDVLGRPRAFIESAWRRYTKHSRNKAQEIQGAIAPLAETYHDCHPFLGAILAGEYTEGSLAQLRSHKFNLVYCRYDTIVQAFATEGVDVSTEEDTSEVELQRKVESFDKLSEAQRENIAYKIRELNAAEFKAFFAALRACLDRRIEHVFVLTLSGLSRQLESIEDAVRFVEENDEEAPVSEFIRYELTIRYTNGDEVRGSFREKSKAIGFLRSLEL